MTVAIAVLAVWAVAAYLIIPFAWRHHERQPGLAALPMRTATAAGIPGDPLNIGLVGDPAEIIRAFRAAGWYPADRLTFATAIRIAGSVVFDRPYRDAPVSALYYDGRIQDLAFERPDGTSADRRHHVRFWQTLAAGAEGRPVFLGAATFDRGVGLAHTTGQITHHIAADVDAERDLILADLARAGMLTTTYVVTGTGPTLSGRNGGGDRWFSDGELGMGVIAAGPTAQAAAPEAVAPPAPVQVKQGFWRLLRRLLD